VGLRVRLDPEKHRMIYLTIILIVTTTRLEVRLSDQVNQRLEALAAAEGLTKIDMFRRALALYMPAEKQEEAGARLQFAHGDQVETLINI
jgi:predicted transcriptional regulator